MVEIIEAKYTYQYVDKYGNTRKRNKTIKYERKSQHIGRPSKYDITPEKRLKVIEMSELPYKVPIKEIARLNDITPYQVKKIIWEYQNN